MDYLETRKLILYALYSDKILHDLLVLKGGNALSLVYNIGGRTSLDLDFSINNDFDNIEDISKRIEKTLTDTFSSHNILVFDYIFSKKPKKTEQEWWGGYHAEFKLIPISLAQELEFKHNLLQRQSLTIDPGSDKRKYTIEISKFEFIDNPTHKNFEGVDIKIYPPLLLAAEKLRALLQQHNSYTQISKETKRSRGRDLYDIWAICDYFAIKLDAHIDTIEAVFDAKKVDMLLLNDLKSLKSLHRETWGDVENSVVNFIESYDYYFDYVDKIAKNLYSRWVKNSP
jgi:predicted nucleotidyltransferase component of viral defense system